MNVSIIVQNKILFFNLEKQKEIVNINNTNIIDVDNLYFSSDFIKENPNLISHFLSILIIKYNIEDAVFKNNYLGELFIPIIDNLKKVKEITFLEDNAINFKLFELLKKSDNIEIINVYVMQPYMFDVLTNRYGKLVRTKMILELSSNFAIDNQFNSYSDIYYKKSIVIKNLFKKSDYNDLEDFFRVNYYLETIYIFKFDIDILNELIHLIKHYNIKNINLVFSYSKSAELTRITNFKEQNNALMNNNHINIDYKYKLIDNKDYARRSYTKLIIQIAVLFLIMVVLSLVLVFLTKNTLDNKNTYDAITKLETIKDDFKALKEKNNDYVGWINIKNTAFTGPLVLYSNGYYNNHDINKKRNFNGWITYKEKDNNILVEASLRNKVLTGGIKEVLYKKWYSNNDNLIINIKKDIKEDYQVISIYEDDKKDIKREEILKKSIYDFKTKFSDSDILLSIRVCDYKCIYIHSRRK